MLTVKLTDTVVSQY